MMFSRVLIANRGEIALRVIRTCKNLGISTVAIYSDVDEAALHVAEADEAICIGGITPRESYLDVDKVLNAALKSGAEAIHPGYGFLSENAAFARLVAEHNFTFIGPSPEAIAMLGDKTAARALAKRVDVPVAPGSDGSLSSLDEIRALIGDIGLPVIIKAAAGGGGKGMRIVDNEAQLESLFRQAQSEALASFNDERVFIERYIDRPRHIEFQILADHHGNVVYFPERECSIQRRHQKVIEESPSVAVTPLLRAKMGEAAARLVQAAGYTNAGTLEFLLDGRGDFYFMEVNTRLQVEHPVTEMVTGIDFVEQQLRIASGEPMSVRQQDVMQPKGHAIECRICAEDVFSDFLPDIGRVEFMRLPEGTGIRNDSALYVGYEVTVHYDPMVAKLIVWAEDRSTCIERTKNALDHYHLAGFKTTIPFCRLVVDSEPFLLGEYSTFFTRDHWPLNHNQDIDQIVGAIAAAGFVNDQKRRRPLPITEL
ncbi:MAG: acetyl-CoA carboxylase biotin carboxylase subunit [Ignavibacteria bacterium]|nr:acetyl-CoA carboxylase biotin carboxylase subunit [Ignavibacteria bacterium]